MKVIRTRKRADFRWSALALVVTASLMTIAEASAASASQPGTRPAAAPVASAAAPTDSAIEIRIDNFVFSPVVVKVKVGTQVTWVNKDDIPHTVDSAEGKFKSAALDTDDKFQFRFTVPGEYPFYCRMHPKMTGKIIVQP